MSRSSITPLEASQPLATLMSFTTAFVHVVPLQIFTVLLQ